MAPPEPAMAATLGRRQRDRALVERSLALEIERLERRLSDLKQKLEQVREPDAPEGGD